MSRKKDTQDPRPTGKQIRKALIDIDQTPMDLAKAMGVSAYYIREIYAERRAARDMRKKIAAYLATQYRRYGYPLHSLIFPFEQTSRILPCYLTISHLSEAQYRLSNYGVTGSLARDILVLKVVQRCYNKGGNH